MTDTARLAALLHEPCVERWQHRGKEGYGNTLHGVDAPGPLAARLTNAGARLASPLDPATPEGLREAALGVDVLWDEPDPGTPDEGDDLIWMTDSETAMRDALRGLRTALAAPADPRPAAPAALDVELLRRATRAWVGDGGEISDPAAEFIAAEYVRLADADHD
jgi:hypothetical protein